MPFYFPIKVSFEKFEMPTQEDINNKKAHIDRIKQRLEGTDISLVFDKTHLMLFIFIACGLHQNFFQFKKGYGPWPTGTRAANAGKRSA